MDRDHQTNNISTLIYGTQNDFFEELYSDTVTKQATIITFIIGSVIGLLLEFGIIWYERKGNHRYRTVINQMFSTVSWLVICYICFVYTPEGIRYLAGPFNATYCDALNCLRNFFATCIVLTLDLIIVLRYIFIFKLSNFAVLDDDLIATFLQISILVLSFWFAMVKRLSVGKMPLNYFLCAGKDPNERHDPRSSLQEGSGKFDTTVILFCLSFILHIFVHMKIFLYQRKVEHNEKNIKVGRLGDETKNGGQQGTRTQPRGSTMPISMADLTTQFLCLTFFAVNAGVVTALNKIHPEDLNSHQSRFLVYCHQIIFIAVALVGITAQYYAKNTMITKHILRSLRENLQCHTRQQ